jgi:glycosyltransferase involved in cell wall biosynthesis
MRIGLFTDSYRPQHNGVAMVVESTKNMLEKLGHEVYVICPSRTVFSPQSIAEKLDDHVIRLKSLPVVGPDASRVSMFLPPKLLKQIKDLRLDVLHFFTPSVIGLMAVYAAKKTHTTLVAQHCTDVYSYIDFYPILRPGILFSSLILPLATDMNHKQKLNLAKTFFPSAHSQPLVKRVFKTLIAIAYSNCDAVISVSPKSHRQLKAFTRGSRTDIYMIPNGVDPLPPTTDKKVAAFRKKHGLSESDEVVVCFGRLAAEKNVDMLIPMIERVVRERPQAKLLLAGDNEYRQVLEAKARDSKVADHIVFSGYYERRDINTICAVSDVWVFPSTTDTQGVVAHEAALGGLPLVIVDKRVTSVLEHGVNGYFCNNSPAGMAWRVLQILGNKQLRRRMSAASVRLAEEYTELGQVEKIVDVYRQAVRRG